MARILISEPYAEVRELLVRIVNRLGYNPVCQNGSADVGEIDAVLIEPSYAAGVELACRLRAEQPDLPIVCVSIYPPTDEIAALRPHAYLLKPFTLAELERALADAVAAPYAA